MKNSTETRQDLVAIRKCSYADLNTKVFDLFCSDRARNTPTITSEDSDDHIATQTTIDDNPTGSVRCSTRRRSPRTVKSVRKLFRQQLRGRTVRTC